VSDPEKGGTMDETFQVVRAELRSKFTTGGTGSNDLHKAFKISDIITQLSDASLLLLGTETKNFTIEKARGKMAKTFKPFFPNLTKCIETAFNIEVHPEGGGNIFGRKYDPSDPTRLVPNQVNGAYVCNFRLKNENDADHEYLQMCAEADEKVRPENRTQSVAFLITCVPYRRLLLNFVSKQTT
jgi:hypothetical protein